MGVQAAGVCVIVGGGVEGIPFFHHEETGAYLQSLVGACHEEGGGDIFARRRWYLQHQGEVDEAFTQWDCEVGQRVDRKVFAHGGGGNRGAPVQGEVVGGQSYREVPRRVKGSEGGEGGEGWGEPGSGGVVGGRSARDPEGSQSSPVAAVGINRREAGFACEYGGGGRVEVVGDPSADPVPK